MLESTVIKLKDPIITFYCSDILHVSMAVLNTPQYVPPAALVVISYGPSGASVMLGWEVSHTTLLDMSAVI